MPLIVLKSRLAVSGTKAPDPPYRSIFSPWSACSHNHNDTYSHRGPRSYMFMPLIDGVTLARRGTNTYGGLNIRLSAIKQMKLNHHGVQSAISWTELSTTLKVGLEPSRCSQSRCKNLVIARVCKSLRQLASPCKTKGYIPKGTRTG